MQKCPLVQSAFLSGFWTDLRHQYGIFGGESQTSLFPFRSSLRDVNERRLYAQANRSYTFTDSFHFCVVGEVTKMNRYEKNHFCSLKLQFITW